MKMLSGAMKGMFHRVWVQKSVNRYLTTSEVSTALRPFYFSVHPDLFWPYPQQKMVNENSLKQLSEYLEAIQSKRTIRTTPISFYLRQNSLPKGEFKQVTIYLNDHDVRKTVVNVLKACSISTEFVDGLVPATRFDSRKTPYYRTNRDVSREFDEKQSAHADFINMRAEVNKSKDSIRLRSWVQENSIKAKENFEATMPTRIHVNKLKKELCDVFRINEINWDCGWNIRHIRGCLQSFLALAQNHPLHMKSVQGKTIVFGQFTGVSLDGDVFLSSVEVRNNWLELLKHIDEQSTALLSIPKYEKSLSQVLRNIRIKRRKFMPKVLGKEYCKHLRRLITSVGDFYGSGKNFPENVPDSLRNFEIVVEPEAGPLMLSPTGQFSIPASCPASELMPFISNNLDLASQRLVEYNINKYVKRDAVKAITDEFGLRDFGHDDSVTPDLMISCCEKLMKLDRETRSHLQECILYVTTYYSVMGDGVLCIPWDFKE